MEIKDFIELVESAQKNPTFGKEEYQKNFPEYKQLSFKENGIKKCPKHRLKYEVVWDNKCKQHIIFVLFNPSYANSNILDGTLKNCAKICYALQYLAEEKIKIGGMIIYNTFTIRHPQVEKAIENIDSDYEFKHNPFFKLNKEIPQNAAKIIIAWGNMAKNKLKKEYFNKLKAVICKLQENNIEVYAYKITKENQPAHLSPKCNRYVREFIENKNPKLETITKLS